MSSSEMWFIPYITYFPVNNSQKTNGYGYNALMNDLDKAVKAGVKYIVMEDYWYGPKWGDYSHYASSELLKNIIIEIHNRDLKFLPYFCLTEADSTSKVFLNHQNSKVLNHKNRNSPGFMNFLLPYYKEFDFRTFLMCTSEQSGWHSILLEEIQKVIEFTEADGVYLDRADYRVRCFNEHHGCGGESEFSIGLISLVKKIKKLADELIGERSIVCLNDSCLKPDPIAKGCFNAVDMLLAEVLPTDMDPFDPILNLYPIVAPIGWKLRYFLKPGLNILLSQLLSIQSSSGKERMEEILKRLKKIAPSKPIYFFQHGKGLERRRLSHKNAKQLGENSCFCFGRDRFVNIT